MLNSEFVVLLRLIRVSIRLVVVNIMATKKRARKVPYTKTSVVEMSLKTLRVRYCASENVTIVSSSATSDEDISFE